MFGISGRPPISWTLLATSKMPPTALTVTFPVRLFVNVAPKLEVTFLVAMLAQIWVVMEMGVPPVHNGFYDGEIKFDSRLQTKFSGEWNAAADIAALIARKFSFECQLAIGLNKNDGLQERNLRTNLKFAADAYEGVEPCLGIKSPKVPVGKSIVQVVALLPLINKSKSCRERELYLEIAGDKTRGCDRFKPHLATASEAAFSFCVSALRLTLSSALMSG